MTTTFSEMVKEFITDGNTSAIPNPAQSGYLCMPADFLSELLRFVSMMQVMKVGVSSEIAKIKKDLKIVNQFLKETNTQNKLYIIMVEAVHRIEHICVVEGERAQVEGKVSLTETYAWSIAGCKLFIEYIKLKES